MKIEIEFEEVEHLKNEIKQLKIEKYSLEEELKKLSPDEIKEQGVLLAENMFKSAMGRIFKEIGFEGGFNSWDMNFSTLVHYLGKDWPKDEKLDLNIGATLCLKFKEAFVRFGIKYEEK